MRRAVDAPVPINPAVPVDSSWLLVGLGLIALAVLLPVVLVVLRRFAMAQVTLGRSSGLEQLRSEHLARVDLVVSRWREDQLSASDAVRAASAEARGFLGVVLDRDVDFMTLQELQQMAVIEPRVRETVELVRRAYPLTFAGHGSESADELLVEFRQVISRWS